jgi:hypothetical protein
MMFRSERISSGDPMAITTFVGLLHRIIVVKSMKATRLIWILAAMGATSSVTMAQTQCDKLRAEAEDLIKKKNEPDEAEAVVNRVLREYQWVKSQSPANITDPYAQALTKATMSHADEIANANACASLFMLVGRNIIAQRLFYSAQKECDESVVKLAADAVDASKPSYYCEGDIVYRRSDRTRVFGSK